MIFIIFAYLLIVKGHSGSPTKWVNHFNHMNYYEKKNNMSWLEYYQNKIFWNFTQVWTGTDKYGDPVVIIWRVDKLVAIELTEGKLFRGSTPTTISESHFTPGYWGLEAKKDETCYQLPNNCEKIKSKRRDREGIFDSKQFGIFCVNRFDEKRLRQFANAWKGCPSIQCTVFFIAIKSFSRQQRILDESFAVFNLASYIPKLTYAFELDFLDLNGFDIESEIELEKIEIVRFHTSFQLYRQNRAIKDCADFNYSNSQRGFILKPRAESFLKVYFILKSNYRYPICSLFFRHVRMDEIIFHRMAKSYLLENMIAFSNPQTNDTIYLNSSINNVWIEESYGVDLNSKFLNAAVFANTTSLFIFSHVNSIDKNVFSPFRQLTWILFYAPYLIRVIRRQGIEWIKSINADIDIDNWKNNLSELFNSDRFFWINLHPERDFILSGMIHFASDQDLCLFADFPFNQLIMIKETQELIDNAKISNYTCTELWLYQPMRTRYGPYNNGFDECQFARRFQMCNRNKFPANNPNIIEFSTFDFWLVFDLVIMVLTLLFASYGIVTNLLTIFIIYHRKNKETTREKHYVYMSLHCAANTLICLIQIFNLMSECQYSFGFFYCSAIRLFKAIQYIKIVFGEYFNSLLRLMSNFTYLSFSLCRMFKVGQDHGKLIVFANDSSIKKNMLAFLLISAGLAVCKALQFDINLDMPEYAAPIAFVQNSMLTWVFNPNYVAITVINSIYDFINNFVFVVIHLVVDLFLIVKLKRTIEQKEKSMRAINYHGLDKILKENRDSKRRVVLMVVISSLFNLFTKVPSIITSMNDLRLIMQKPISKEDSFFFIFNPIGTNLSFSFFCSSLKICLSFNSFGNCLFLLSFSSTLHFLKLFDKNFKLAYDQVFAKTKNQLK